jgi:carboxyl-terminal processing protease
LAWALLNALSAFASVDLPIDRKIKLPMQRSFFIKASKTMPSFKTRSVYASLLCASLLCAIALSLPRQANAAFGNDHRLIGESGRNEKLVSQFVWKMMERDHLSKRNVDDDISRRAFSKYIKSLDPTKAYFRKSDIEEFSKWKTRLDDQLKNSDYSAAFQIYERFLQRVDQQTELAIELVDANHDFSLDEEVIVDPDLADYAKDDAAAREDWRKRIKYNLLVLRGRGDELADETKPDPKELLRKRYRSLARRIHQLDREDVIERYISSITSSFDPHTSYLSRGSFDNFMIQMNLELDGIGASLQGSDEGYTVIKSLVDGGAAANQGGLKAEDKIVAVAQGNERGGKADPKLVREYGTDFVDATGMSVDDVVEMIRGTAGTVVRLSVISEGQSGFHAVSLVREKIKLEDRAAQGAIFEEGENAEGSPNRIGVLELPMFYAGISSDGGEGRSTTTDVRRILDDFNQKNVDTLILDLRNNGGGSLKEAVDCTGLFIDAGPVVQVKDSRGRIEVLNDTDRGVAWKKPMIVLTSKFSASASEILAGAIQDYQRGLIVGDTATHGKGTVQNLLNISQIVYNKRNAPNDFGALKITTQQFYRPNGDSTQQRGVLADLVLPSVTDKMDVSESDLDYPVEFDRVRRARFGSYAMTSPRLIKMLGERSASRRNSSAEFQKQLANISKYVENKNLKTVSLNEEQFLARQKLLSDEKEEEQEIAEQMMTNEITRDFYLNEVLRISSDYTRLLSEPSKTAQLTAADRS